MAGSYALSAVKAGITRLRTKGGASPESLYDLENGYVSAARTILPRPGSKSAIPGGADLPDGTIGLTLFNGVFQVFSSTNVGVMPAGFKLNILTHPTNAAAGLKEIWFAEPFMGLLYVVAEWDDDPNVAYHYYMEESGSWQPDHIYKIGDVVEPVVPNGYRYRAHRLTAPGEVWKPDVARAVGDKVEPTVYNGFEYTVIDTIGLNPRSGTTEPTWIAEDGAVVIEDASGLPPGGGGTSEPPPPTTPPRYDNPGGNRPNYKDPLA